MKKSENRFLHILLSFALLFIYSQAFSVNNKIDSLLNLVKIDKEDTNKVIHQYKLCREYSNIGEFGKGLSYGKQALLLAQKLNFKRGIAYAYNNVGVIYFNYGNYSEALKNYFASLKAHEESNNKQGIATAYNNIGNVYKEQGDFSEALKNHFIALKMRKEISDKGGLAMSYNNIGNIYKSQRNYQEALKMHFAALKLLEENNNKLGIAVSHNNIGTSYLDQGNYAEALKQFNASLKIREEIKDKNGMASSFINLGELFLKEKKTKEAQNYLNKALEVSIEIESKDAIKDCYSNLSTLDSMMGDYKTALAHHKLFMIYKDSLYNEETKKKSIQAGMQYEFDKKENEIKLLANETEILKLKVKNNNYLIISLIGFALLILITIFFLIYRNKLRSQQVKSEFEKSLLQSNIRTLRAQMNPHFIFNSLNSIQGLIDINENKKASKFVGIFSDLTRNILDYSENTKITLKEELDFLNKYIEIETLGLDSDFECLFNLDENLDVDNIEVPSLIVQPIIENAIVHGLFHKEGIKKLYVNVTETANGFIEFVIIDNGIGRRKAKELRLSHKKHESKGIKIILERLQIINNFEGKQGSLSYVDLEETEGKTGTKAILLLPIL